MSAPAVVYTLLAAHPDVAAIVSDRIYPEMLPEGKPVPALAYRVISDLPDLPVDQAPMLRHRRARVQIDAITSNDAYPARLALLLAVRRAMHGHVGAAVAGVPAVVVREIGTGPDLQHERAGLSSSSIDVLVTYHQAV